MLFKLSVVTRFSVHRNGIMERQVKVLEDLLVFLVLLDRVGPPSLSL